MSIAFREESRKNTLIGFLILLMWPILAVFYAIKNFRFSISKWIIIIVYAYAAYFYHFDPTGDIDVVRHADRLEAIAAYDASYISDRFVNLFGSEKYKPDLLQPMLDYIISRFTTNYSIYFFILGGIMGFALISYLTKVYKYYLINPDIYIWLLFFLILVVTPPYRVAGFRGIVAGVFFLYAAYKARVENKKEYNLLILLSPLMHFGYLGVVPFYYLSILLGNRFTIYVILIGVAFFVKDYVPSYIGSVAGDAESELSNRVRGYSSEKYFEEFNVNRVGVLMIIRYQMHWTVLAFVLLFVTLFKKFNQADVYTKRIFSLVLSYLILLTLLMNMEVVFVRFSSGFVLLSSLAIVMLFSDSAFKMTWFPKLVILSIFIFNFIVMARKSIEFTGLEVLMPNLILSSFMDIDYSILDLIK